MAEYEEDKTDYMGMLRKSPMAPTSSVTPAARPEPGTQGPQLGYNVFGNRVVRPTERWEGKVLPFSQEPGEGVKYNPEVSLLGKINRAMTSGGRASGGLGLPIAQYDPNAPFDPYAEAENFAEVFGPGKMGFRAQTPSVADLLASKYTGKRAKAKAKLDRDVANQSMRTLQIEQRTAPATSTGVFSPGNLATGATIGAGLLGAGVPPAYAAAIGGAAPFVIQGARTGANSAMGAILGTQPPLSVRMRQNSPLFRQRSQENPGIGSLMQPTAPIPPDDYYNPYINPNAM